MPFKIGDLVETCDASGYWTTSKRNEIPARTRGWVTRITAPNIQKNFNREDVTEIGKQIPAGCIVSVRFLLYPVQIYAPNSLRNITNKQRKQEDATKRALEIQQARTFGPHYPRRSEREAQTQKQLGGCAPRTSQNREVAGTGDGRPTSVV